MTMVARTVTRRRRRSNGGWDGRDSEEVGAHC